MTRTFDELMKLLDEKGSLSDEDGKKIIDEHGPLSDDEKKNLAAAIKMRKALTKEAPKDTPPADGEKPEAAAAKPAEAARDEEVTMDAYLQALSVLDSDSATAEDKAAAQKAKEKFESQ